MDCVQSIGNLGILSSRGVASHSRGNKKEIFGTPCVLWHNRNHAWYHHGNKCLRKGTRGTPNEAIGSPKFCNCWLFNWEWSWVLISEVYYCVSYVSEAPVLLACPSICWLIKIQTPLFWNSFCSVSLDDGN